MEFSQLFQQCCVKTHAFQKNPLVVLELGCGTSNGAIAALRFVHTLHAFVIRPNIKYDDIGWDSFTLAWTKMAHVWPRRSVVSTGMQMPFVVQVITCFA